MAAKLLTIIINKFKKQKRQLAEKVSKERRIAIASVGGWMI